MSGDPIPEVLELLDAAEDMPDEIAVDRISGHAYKQEFDRLAAAVKAVREIYPRARK